MHPLASAAGGAPQRRAADRDHERRVTFLELFYDLVYVVLISQVAHHLSGHIDAAGVFEAGLLFVLLWIAWVNGTLYHDVHGDNDVRTRVYTFLQMAAVAGMAVFAHDAFGHGAAGFALSFAGFQTLLTWLWWQTGMHDPVHRPLSTPYAAGFGLSAALFAVSAFVDAELRVVLWSCGLLLSAVVPLVSVVWTPDDPAVRAERDRTRVVTASVVERFDLLTIIVLGEVIVGVVDGVSGTHALGGVQVAAAGLGLLLAFALWWLYFDVVAHRRPVPGPLASAWFYLHLPVAAGIAATGAAVLDLVGHAGEALPSEERGLLVASVAVTQAGVGALLWTLPLARDHGGRARVATVLLALSILGTLSVGLTTLSSVWTLLVTDALLLVPVGYSLWVWVTVYGGEEPTIDASSGLVEDG